MLTTKKTNQFLIEYLNRFFAQRYGHWKLKWSMATWGNWDMKKWVHLWIWNRDKRTWGNKDMGTRRNVDMGRSGHFWQHCLTFRRVTYTKSPLSCVSRQLVHQSAILRSVTYAPRRNLFSRATQQHCPSTIDARTMSSPKLRKVAAKTIVTQKMRQPKLLPTFESF